MLATALAVLRLAWQSVRRRPLSSILTALVVALGVGLVVAVETVRASADRSFTETARGYDVILGPPQGSPLQVVLSTLFHVDEPPGTLPWSAYEGIREDPRVAAAIPYAMGDTYRGHRVVGTTAEMFEVLFDGEGRRLQEGMRGRVFGAGRFEAVVGSAVASRTGMGIGTTFGVSHGLVEGGQPHDQRWAVVGVLRPTGTAHDRAIYMPIETFYAIPGHTVPDQEEGKRPLSAVGVRLKSPALRLLVLQEYRTDTAAAQAVLPADQVRKLMGIVGDVNRGVTVVAWIVTLVAAVSVLVGLYNTIQGRRREIAVLRALGARPAHVFGLILLEALILCLLGGAFGLLLGHGGVAAMAPTLLESYGVRVQVGVSSYDLQVLGALFVLGLLAGLLPAWRGLTTPVADNLQAEL